jgi:hypothetical protein
MDIVKSVNWLSREQVVNMLTEASIQCYDHETTKELREALVANIEDGTISLPEEYQLD